LSRSCSGSHAQLLLFARPGSFLLRP
jgi:hypothetical protein